MKKAVIKNKVNKLKISMTAVLLSVVSIVSVSSSVVNFSTDKFYGDKYSSQEQIEQLAEDIACDTSYLKEKETNKGVVFRRQPHNNGEPIYVAISDNYSQETKHLVEQSLDYVFGVIGSINNNYYYEIVDKVPENKNSIQYLVTDLKLENNYGKARSKDYNDDGYNDQNIIFLDDDYVNIEDSKKLYVLQHELLHIFGFDDVYAEEIGGQFEGVIKTNTYMQNANYEYNYNLRGTNITPNDFKCLLALYSPKANSKEEYNHMIEFATKKVELFEQEFYANQIERLDACYKRNFKRLNVPKIFDFAIQNFKSEANNFKVQVRDNRYKITFFNDDGTIKETKKGNVSYVKGCAVLHNVKLTNVQMYGQTYDYIGDFMVSYGSDGVKDKMFIYDFVNEELGQAKLTYQLENDLEINN